MMPTWDPKRQAEYRAWRSNPLLLGEVKTRQVCLKWGHEYPNQTLYIRHGVNRNTSFFPFVDFYVLIFIDFDGSIAMARRLDLDAMVDYVASPVPNGRVWNYRAAFHRAMKHGIDLTPDARKALHHPL